MKTNSLFLLCAFASLALLPAATFSQDVKVDFGGSTSPYRAVAVIKSVDFETTQSVDIALPANFLYKVESVEAIVRTAPSAQTTPAKVSMSSVSGGTATLMYGGVNAEADSAAEIDTLFNGSANGGGYVYYVDVATATTSGLCTQNVTLNTPGALAGIAQPDVPRKIVLTLVDNAGANLAGTVTLVGTTAEGEEITEVITVVAGTVSYTTSNVFATLTSGSHNFGVLGQATVDTLNLGQSTSIGLPSDEARPIKVVVAGTEEAAATVDADNGSFTLTTAPNGVRDFEVWYRAESVDKVFTGGNTLRLGITGATVTGSDVRDVIVTLLKF